MSRLNPTPDKVDVLEALTKVHFSNAQQAEVDLSGYFDTLRDIGWNINDNMDLMATSETARDILWEQANGKR